MPKSVTFRMEDDKLQAIDHLAASMERDRSYILNEAVENYIELRRWHLAEIRKGVEEADAGDFASEQEVKAAFDAFKAPL
jgi:predicted transcriptional regulator